MRFGGFRQQDPYSRPPPSTNWHRPDNSQIFSRRTDRIRRFSVSTNPANDTHPYLTSYIPIQAGRVAPSRLSSQPQEDEETVFLTHLI